MINDIAFNQDYSCVSVATDLYHKIYQCDPFGEFYSSVHAGRKRSISSSLDGGEHKLQQEVTQDPTRFLKMLFSTSLTIIVPQSSLGNKVLKIYNLKQNTKICELSFSTEIIDIKLNKKRLLVFLESGQLHIYDLSCVRLIKVLQLNASSSLVGDFSIDAKSLLVVPIAALSPGTELFEGKNDNGSLGDFIQFIKDSKVKQKSKITIEDIQKDHGWLLVYDTINLRPQLIFKAHDSEIVNVRISKNGTKIITASTKGTIIRIFHIANDKIDNITNLRRGHNLAKITALSFNGDDTIVGCGSDNDTIHLFKIDEATGSSSTDADEQTTDNEDGEEQDEDINENLANLLISKTDDDNKTNGNNGNKNHYFNFQSIKKSINNSYTKTIMKKLPYKDYLENLIWQPPRRSFAYIKLQESHPRLEIGFNNDIVLIVSYETGIMYRYQLPKAQKIDPEEKRESCTLINQYQLT